MTRKTALGLATAAAFTVAIGVTGNQVLDDGHLSLPWLGTAIAVALLSSYLTLRQNPPDTTPAPIDPDTARKQSLDALAAAVEAVWKPEQSRRRLLNPRPLPTAWATISPPVADHWANVRTDGVDEPLDLSGVVDPEHPDAFHDLVVDPRLRGRIVLLGDPGAGKTGLLLRLTLTLLAARRHTTRADTHPTTPAPVPVLLRLSTWNPDEQPLDQWITTRLEADYGHRRPVPTEHLMPLLDGLDEMPEPRRRQVLRAISATFTDAPLVITSRTNQYLDTLTALNRDTLAAAAVLELIALKPETIRDYLQLTTARPVDWTSVFTHDTADHDSRLAAALSAPLWVDLARTAYTDPDQPDNNPTELLALADKSADAVHGHLLDRLIPAAYPIPDRPGTDGRTWTRADAQRWLHALAQHLRARDSQDIAWWELSYAVPPSLRILAVGLVAGLATGLAVGFAVGLATGPVTGLTVGLTAGLATGLPTGLTAGLMGGLTPPAPSRRQIRWRHTTRPILHRLVAGLVAGLVGGLVIGFAAGLVAGFVAGFAVGFAAGLVAGFAAGLPVGFAVGFAGGLAGGLVAEFTTLFAEGDADIPAATDPLGLLRDDRRHTLAVPLAVGLMVGLMVGFAVGFAVGLAVGLAYGLAYGSTKSAWGQFQLARIWWWSHGRSPRNLMVFLSDAHHRGVLRQAGGVYQFRHALLRDRLAATNQDSPATGNGPFPVTSASDEHGDLRNRRRR